ncbi:MAG: glycosylase [Oscillospiraceae bacterium]|nr:glycosylase [Oscillospiraceae bacterium]
MTEWLKTAVFYEIYPQSFCDSNADGIGDFRGIEQKLPYLEKLGVNAIWMNPCFDSSFFDAGYDVRDYYSVAPRYGNNEDLRHLLRAVHDHGMHLLLDLVPGHTAIDHPWFAESCLDEPTPSSNRYIWRVGGPRRQGYQGIAGFLSGISERPGMAAFNCFSTQPALNYGFAKVTEPWQFSWDSPEAEQTRLLMQDIMSFWLDLGCDGFRVDMAGSLVKEDENRTCTIQLWQKVRAFLNENYPDAVLVSEWGNPLQALEAGFHMDFLLHHGPTHYMDLFRENPYFSSSGSHDLSAFISYYREAYEQTKGKGLICIPSGNHDMIRLRETLTMEESKLAFAFLLTMPGCPFLYYGDEIGMRYVHGLKSKEGGYERTGSRTPMQWGRGYNALFSSAAPQKLYLPLDASDDRPTVEEQWQNNNSLLCHVQSLIAFRKAHSALRSDAFFAFLSDGEGVPLLYRRWDENEDLLIALNPSDHEAVADCSVFCAAPSLLLSYRGAAFTDGGKCILPPGSYAVFANNSSQGEKNEHPESSSAK